MTVDPSTAELDRLYRLHRSTLVRFLRRRVRDEGVVDDVIAETFVAAAVVLRSDGTDELTAGWFITVASRRLNDHWRHHYARRRRSRGAGFSALRDSDEASTAIDVRRALTTLPERQRVALCTRYLLGGSVDDVAAVIGCSYPSAESLLARGRRSFRAAYVAA